MLAGHHALIRSALAAHDGREVDTQGDEFFAVFSSPRACVAAVLEMQQAIGAFAWPGGERVRVRMGIHCGEAARTPTGLVGLEVHRAARVAAVAHGGQVLVSEAAAALVRGWLPPGAALADLGSHRLKDLGRPERIFQLTAAGLQAEFPPLRSLGNPALPNNLPAQVSAFIGRGRELAEVRALLESARLVTLTGVGGCGKTRLGLQVAAELLDGSGDGVWLAELAAVTDQDAVAAAISEALRLAARPGRPALEALLDALALQDVLIVLDNCEHLIGGCAKTAEAIVRRCPRVHLLATSREPLGIGGETIYRVPSLSLPGPEDSGFAPGSSDAVALFTDRAWANGVVLSVDEQAGPVVVSVCRRLDGMPLAIELAAARLRSMSLAELHGRLDQRFGLLTGAAHRGGTPADAAGDGRLVLFAACATGDEQLLLARLSVFGRHGFGLDAGRRRCAGPVTWTCWMYADPRSGSLVDKSLVVAEQAGAGLRYRLLLETIRLFAAERLVEAWPRLRAAAVAAAHCAHFLAAGRGGGGVSDRAGAGRLAGPGWTPTRPTLRRAARHAVGLAGRDHRWCCAWASRSGESATGGPVTGSRRVSRPLVPVLRRPDADADPALFAAALITAAIVASLIDLPTARQLAEQAGPGRPSAGRRAKLLSRALAAMCGAYLHASTSWRQGSRSGRNRSSGARAARRRRAAGLEPDDLSP